MPLFPVHIINDIILRLTTENTAIIFFLASQWRVNIVITKKVATVCAAFQRPGCGTAGNRPQRPLLPNPPRPNCSTLIRIKLLAFPPSPLF